MPDTSAPREAPVLDDAKIKLVQDSFVKVDSIAEDAAAMFYDRLFEIAPDLQPLFKGDMKAQGRKLMTMIKTAVNGLKDLGALVSPPWRIWAGATSAMGSRTPITIPWARPRFGH
jgi:hypothetical protein